MNWDTAGLVLGIVCFVFWLYCMYRMFAANRSGNKKPGYTVVDPEPAASPDDLVTVAQFADQLTADLYRVHLESEGIEGMVFGNSFSRRHPRYVLQVRSEDAPRATEVLKLERS